MLADVETGEYRFLGAFMKIFFVPSIVGLAVFVVVDGTCTF